MQSTQNLSNTSQPQKSSRKRGATGLKPRIGRGPSALLGALGFFVAIAPAAHAEWIEPGQREANSVSLADADGPLVIFSGMRSYADGSVRLQVKLTADTPVEFSQEERTLVFLLKGAKIQLKNNKHALRAEYFHSNVVRTKLDDTDAGVRYTIQLRSIVSPQYEMVNHAGGAILRVDIPPAKNEPQPKSL